MKAAGGNVITRVIKWKRRILPIGISGFLLLAQFATATTTTAKNSWRGIIPLRSSATQVAEVIGRDPDTPEGDLSGPFVVDGGRVSFSFLTPTLAKIYRAPAPLVGKVFTVYFEPDQSIDTADLKRAGFKRCVEENDREYYYLVSDFGVAYRIKRSSDQVETIIYQPSRIEVRRLMVSVDCVF